MHPANPEGPGSDIADIEADLFMNSHEVMNGRINVPFGVAHLAVVVVPVSVP